MICGLAAGAWLGGAEAPTKLVTVGLSPYVISLAMVAGVFVARWTLPTLLKGTGYVFHDLRARAHLVIWAILAGALWAVANTLTVFAIRDVGLSVAFPLWNINSLVGLFWAWLLFNELRGAGARQATKVLGGALAIVVGACLLAYANGQHGLGTPHRAGAGILAAVGAGLLWGTMYIPYRKAYISGMNPLSFVTVFTVGELITMSALALVFRGGLAPLLAELARARAALFWLFLGGFCWVLGDLFQQYAAKYIGIGRGIPLSNTNQLWGLAWGALVFGELSGKGGATQGLIVAGSVTMVAGAVAISMAEAPTTEQESWRASQRRESERYQLDPEPPAASAPGEGPLAKHGAGRRWWDLPIVIVAAGVFLLLARGARRPPMAINLSWMALLALAMLGFLVACGMVLWERTRFS
ncbi:MAG TPA: EamA family transporter [Terriglobia bacterium]|nr:EamA family transporter [Terriglobia bacterium]